MHSFDSTERRQDGKPLVRGPNSELEGEDCAMTVLEESKKSAELKRHRETFNRTADLEGTAVLRGKLEWIENHLPDPAKLPDCAILWIDSSMDRLRQLVERPMVNSGEYRIAVRKLGEFAAPFRRGKGARDE